MSESAEADQVVSEEPAAKRQRTTDADAENAVPDPQASISSAGVPVKTEAQDDDDSSLNKETAPVKTDPDGEDEDSKPAASDNNVVKLEPVMVEFKFSSYETQLFKAGAFKGTLHIEMVQNPTSGMYSVPVGKSRFHAVLDDVKTENWCSGRTEFQEFNGTLSRAVAGGPIEMEDSGLSLDYASGNHRNFQARVRPHDVDKRHPNFNDTKVWGSTKFVAEKLSEWEQGQGGFLDLVANVDTEWTNNVRWGWYGGTFPETRAAWGKYKIKLYTVLSAYRPSQDKASLPDYVTGHSPDWNALSCVVAARNPSKNEAWVERAVHQYRHFIDLKVRLRKQKLSPSYAVDEIWHAHLSFPDRYQRDMVCLTRGDGIIEHLPTHFKQSTKYYEKSFNQHSKSMKKAGCPVDEEFWPKPAPYDPSQHESNSDTDKMEGYLKSGKPSKSGCGGCG
ncbi:MAG: hypothetical protein SGILL_005315 [Bacillariaceae sp.]